MLGPPNAGFLSAGECWSTILAGGHDRDDAHVWPGAHGVCPHHLPRGVHQGQSVLMLSHRCSSRSVSANHMTRSSHDSGIVRSAEELWRGGETNLSRHFKSNVQTLIYLFILWPQFEEISKVIHLVIWIKYCIVPFLIYIEKSPDNWQM